MESNTSSADASTGLSKKGKKEKDRKKRITRIIGVQQERTYFLWPM
jgi:hypothetical protein